MTSESDPQFGAEDMYQGYRGIQDVYEESVSGLTPDQESERNDAEKTRNEGIDQHAETLIDKLREGKFKEGNEGIKSWESKGGPLVKFWAFVTRLKPRLERSKKTEAREQTRLKKELEGKIEDIVRQEKANERRVREAQIKLDELETRSKNLLTRLESAELTDEQATEIRSAIFAIEGSLDAQKTELKTAELIQQEEGLELNRYKQLAIDSYTDAATSSFHTQMKADIELMLLTSDKRRLQDSSYKRTLGKKILVKLSEGKLGITKTANTARGARQSVVENRDHGTAPNPEVDAADTKREEEKEKKRKEGIKSDIEKLDGEIGREKDQATELDEDIKTIDLQITEKENKIIQRTLLTEGTITKLGARIDTQKQEIEDIDTEIKALKTSVLSGQEEELDTLIETRRTEEEGDPPNRAEIRRLNKEITQKRNEIKTTLEKVSELRKQRNAKQEKIEELEDKINQLEVESLKYDPEMDEEILKLKKQKRDLEKERIKHNEVIKKLNAKKKKIKKDNNEL